MPRRRSSREGRGAAEGPEGGDAPHETHESRLIHTDTFHTYTPILPTNTTRVHTTEMSRYFFNQFRRPFPRSEYTKTPIERTPGDHTHTPGGARQPGAIDRDDRPHTTTTGRRRRDERSEPGVEGGETVHERWFIRHGRHVRDSAVGQCVIRRDESGLIARFDSNSMHSFIRGWSWVVVGARDASRTRVERRVDRSGRRDRRHARRMDESKDESRRMKDEKRNAREREEERERLTRGARAWKSNSH